MAWIETKNGYVNLATAQTLTNLGQSPTLPACRKWCLVDGGGNEGIECDKQRRQRCAMTKAKQQVLCATRREPIDSAACGTHRG
jgi:hypothetical protein